MSTRLSRSEKVLEWISEMLLWPTLIFWRLSNLALANMSLVNTDRWLSLMFRTWVPGSMDDGMEVADTPVHSTVILDDFHKHRHSPGHELDSVAGTSIAITNSQVILIFTMYYFSLFHQLHSSNDLFI